MILCGVVLVALIGVHSVAITQGQNHDDYSNQGDGCSFLRQGYLDHYGCTLECFRTTFGLEYMRGNLCTAYYELYSNDWGDVPFKKVVTVIECITINCRRAVPQAVCSNSYDYSSNKYQPQGNQNSPYTQPPAYSSSDSSNQNNQPATQSAPGSSPNGKNNNEDAVSKSTSSTGSISTSQTSSIGSISTSQTSSVGSISTSQTPSTSSISTSQSPFASPSAYAKAMDQFMEEEFFKSLTTSPTDTTTDETTTGYTTEYSTPTTLDTTTCDSITDSTLTDTTLTDTTTDAVTVFTTPPTDYTEEPCDDTPPTNMDNNGGYPPDYNPSNLNYNTQNNYDSYGSAVANSGGNSNDKPVQASQNSDGQQQNPGNKISNNYNTNSNNNNKFDTTYEIDGIYQNPPNSNNDYVVSYIEKDYITQDQSGNSQQGNSGVASSQNAGDNNLLSSLLNMWPDTNQPANGQESQNYQGATNNNQFYQTPYDNSAQPIQNPKQSTSAPTNVTTQNTSNNGIFSFLTNLIKPLANQPPASKSPSTVSGQTLNNQTPGNYQGTPNAAQSGIPFYTPWSAAQGPNYQNQPLYPSASNIPVQSNSQPMDSSLFSGVLPPSSQGPNYQIPSQYPFVQNNNYPPYPAPQSSSSVRTNSFPGWGLPQSSQGISQNRPQFPYVSNNNYPPYPAPQSSSSAWANSFPGWGLPQSSQGISQNPPGFQFVPPQNGPQRINAQNGGPFQGNTGAFTIKTANDDQITIFPSGDMVLTQPDGNKKAFKFNQ